MLKDGVFGWYKIRNLKTEEIGFGSGVVWGGLYLVDQSHLMTEATAEQFLRRLWFIENRPTSFNLCQIQEKQ